ncbi:PLDc_N domain-containing protein [Candidatus Sumerlaeota bacterium]|nr:PLDc_N domain-containing protein [Candidatus Sumerlaeota bacterium]
MSELLSLVVIIADVLAIADVLKKFRRGVPRALWIVFILALPLFGAAMWYHVQYLAPKEKQRKRMRAKRERIARQQRTRDE